MEISLEKIELVKDRTGVSYKEAKEALEKTEGNVVDAIILIEDSIDNPQPQASKASRLDGIMADLKAAVKKGNVSKITIKKGDDIILNLPVNAGIVGTVLFPWAVVAATIAAVGTKCSIELTKDDGEKVDISKKAGEAFETVKAKSGVVIDEVRDKSSDFVDYAKEKGAQAYEYAKDKGSDLMDYAKDKGEDLKDYAKDKGSDFVDYARDKGAQAVDYAKEKAANIRWNADEEEGKGADQFDFSDLDLSEMHDDDDREE